MAISALSRLHNTPIPGYEGLYSATDDGRVYSHITEKFMRVSRTRDGIPHVRLSDGHGNARTIALCVVVAAAFLGYAGEGYVHNADGDVMNNAVENLRVDPAARGIKVQDLATGKVYQSVSHAMRETGETRYKIMKAKTRRFIILKEV